MDTAQKIKDGFKGIKGSYVVKRYRKGDIRYETRTDKDGNILKIWSKKLAQFVPKLFPNVEDLKNAVPLFVSPRIYNLVVNGSFGYGKNLVARALLGSTWITTYPIAIDTASIGLDNTAASASQTDLLDPITEDIPVAFGEMTGTSELTLSFFIPDADLPNDTYEEFGLFATGRLIARSVISPAYVKGSSEDTSIDYTIEVT